MIQKFIRDERGATAIEYGLIAVLIAVVIIAGAQDAGSSISAKFISVAETVSQTGL